MSFFKKQAPLIVQELIPYFQPDSEMETLVFGFAVTTSGWIKKELDGMGDESVISRKERKEKLKSLADELKRHAEQNGKAMRAYLKPYIEGWSVVQVPHPDEWHRWYAAAMLCQVFKE